MTDLQSRIIEAVTENWKKTERPLLLANLGWYLRRFYSETELNKELLGGKLSEYIKYNLGNKVRSVHDPKNKAVVALVPPAISESEETLFNKRPLSRMPKNTLATVAGRVQYQPQLWQAFSSSIPPDKDRYLKIDDNIECEDVPKGMPGPTNSVVVTAEDIANPIPGTGSLFPQISAKIEQWATRNKIDISRFKGVSHGIMEKSVLELILETVTDDDLSRISIPLSAVKALAVKKI